MQEENKLQDTILSEKSGIAIIQKDGVVRIFRALQRVTFTDLGALTSGICLYMRAINVMLVSIKSRRVRLVTQ